MPWTGEGHVAIRRFDIEHLDGTIETREMDVIRTYVTGSSTRDPEVARKHHGEIARSGIRISFEVPFPRIYPVSPLMLTSEHEIHSLHDRTSGEAEVLIVVDRGETFVTVGSDHTDRQLEQVSIPWSKQMSPNVIARTLWPWEEVRDVWDDCILSCTLDGRIYSRTTVDVFLTPPDLLAAMSERVTFPETFVVCSGAFAALDETLHYGERWGVSLEDPSNGRTIEHEYRVVDLIAEIREGYRVPAVPADFDPIALRGR